MLTGDVIAEPLIAFDLDLCFIGKIPKGFLERVFQKPNLTAHHPVQGALGRLRKLARVVLLSKYTDKQVQDYIQPLLLADSHDYIIPCAGRGTFELFRDSYLPHTIYSNMPKEWGGVYSDVFPYSTETPLKSFQEVFEHIREEFVF